jgi:GNAT superfamily N-acetyltransferase
MSVKIRAAVPDDAEGIALAHVASWQTSYRGLIPDEDLDNLSIERREAAWLESIRREANAVFVAEVEGRIVGFIAGGPEREGMLRESDGVAFDCELYAIYLLEEVKRQGIGTRLLARFGEYMVVAGFERLLVWVLTDNEAGCRFYEVHGGAFETRKMVNMFGVDLEETSYGWDLPL